MGISDAQRHGAGLALLLSAGSIGATKTNSRLAPLTPLTRTLFDDKGKAVKMFPGRFLLLAAALTVTPPVLGDTLFTEMGSILNTRHNMMQSTIPSYFAMGPYRNSYGEVCVYCHTPHGANTSAQAPLWNRILPATTYTTYNQLINTTVEQTYSQPGGASLACLSCHDGQQAVDAILNMPGSGQYSASASPWTWQPGVATQSTPGGLRKSTKHLGLTVGFDAAGAPSATWSAGCLSCHDPANDDGPADFRIAVIGTDLRNDHPVGVTYPAVNGTGTDWNTPTGIKTVGGQITKFFDETPNGRLDKNEIRLYPSAQRPCRRMRLLSRSARRSLGRTGQQVHSVLPPQNHGGQRRLPDLPRKMTMSQRD